MKVHKFAIGGFSALFTDYPYLSINGSVWGWATWKNRWQKYKELTPSIAEMKRIKKYCSIYSYLKWIRSIDTMTSKMPIDTWDYWWLFTRIRHQGFTILPSKPLTLNIGFDSSQSTHTKAPDYRISTINKRALAASSVSCDLTLQPVMNEKKIRKLDYLRIVARYGIVQLYVQLLKQFYLYLSRSL